MSAELSFVASRHISSYGFLNKSTVKQLETIWNDLKNNWGMQSKHGLQKLWVKWLNVIVDRNYILK